MNTTLPNSNQAIMNQKYPKRVTNKCKILTSRRHIETKSMAYYEFKARISSTFGF